MGFATLFWPHGRLSRTQAPRAPPKILDADIPRNNVLPGLG